MNKPEKEACDYHTASLEMKGGLESDIHYPAKYMHAPKSEMPNNYARSENMRATGNAMKMVMRARR
jgi:hypothetical protein